MELEPRSLAAIRALAAKGVAIPNPLTIDIAPEVDLDRISGDGVVLHPGTRLRGADLVVSAGCVLGEEGPVTVDGCRLGPGVRLKGGHAEHATFLAGASLGLGHHVREGTLLEEAACGAHTVGLKQTILFPFVTLGSLINFCDCLMAGGTSRADHSEVGSSYIHFNFTPAGDKITPSLFGDVPRGVLLDQPPIFLGGQGGAVGPVCVGYGSVVAAGSVLRSDVPDGQLAIVGALPDRLQPYSAGGYRHIGELVAKNVAYISSLRALRAWYEVARRPFFERQDLGDLVLAGALAAIDSGLAERTRRLIAMSRKVRPDDEERATFAARAPEVCERLRTRPLVVAPPPTLVTELGGAAAAGTDYLSAIRALGGPVRVLATAWLQATIDDLRATSAEMLPE